jgi:hypothetical protein
MRSRWTPSRSAREPRWASGQGYLLIVTDADELLGEDAEEYDTFIEIVKDVAKEWATPRHGQFARPPTPFHVCLVVARKRLSARADWRVSRLPSEHAS